MESTEFHLPMGGTINFANGDRLAVTCLLYTSLGDCLGEGRAVAQLHFGYGDAFH